SDSAADRGKATAQHLATADATGAGSATLVRDLGSTLGIECRVRRACVHSWGTITLFRWMVAPISGYRNACDPGGGDYGGYALAGAGCAGSQSSVLCRGCRADRNHNFERLHQRRSARLLSQEAVR